MQLSRLQFVGLSLSACWMLAVIVYERQTEMPKAQNYAMAAYFVCVEAKAAAGDRNIDPCVRNVGNDWEEWMNRKWRDIACISLVPVSAGWLLGFACVRFIRRKKRPTS